MKTSETRDNHLGQPTFVDALQRSLLAAVGQVRGWQIDVEIQQRIAPIQRRVDGRRVQRRLVQVPFGFRFDVQFDHRVVEYFFFGYR